MLVSFLGCYAWDFIDDLELTMLPISVEPRAKMKVICLQAPLSSLAVEPVPPRPNCLRSTVAGMAAAVPASRAMVVVENFMVAVGGGGFVVWKIGGSGVVVWFVCWVGKNESMDLSESDTTTSAVLIRWKALIVEKNTHQTVDSASTYTRSPLATWSCSRRHCRIASVVQALMCN